MQTPINQRVKDLLKALDMTQQEFADSLVNAQVSQSKISRLGTSKRIDPLLVDEICKVHEVSKEWLLNGTGTMFVLPEQDSQIRTPGTGKSAVEFVNTVNRLLDDVEAWRKESETWRGLYLNSQK